MSSALVGGLGRASLMYGRWIGWVGICIGLAEQHGRCLRGTDNGYLFGVGNGMHGNGAWCVCMCVGIIRIICQNTKVDLPSNRIWLFERVLALSFSWTTY